jgi:hypothetical protein
VIKLKTFFIDVIAFFSQAVKSVEITDEKSGEREVI